MVPLTLPPLVAWALGLGAVLGLGLWSLLGRMPRLARPRLAARIAPYLLDVSSEARRAHERLPIDPLPVLGVLTAPAVRAFQTLFGGVLGLAVDTRVRLRQAGDDRGVESYRVSQMLWTLAGALAGLGVAALVVLRNGALPLAVAAPLVGAGCGLVLRDRMLIAAGRRRPALREGELPTVNEVLSLSIAAGEGVHDALRRIARVGSGELAAEFGRATAEVGVGVPLGAALARLADELRIPALTRALTHIIAALERGAPLAELLRAQAADARDEARRALLESAGRKEIGMMVPLVFLILPVTIAFAVFPSLLVLQTGF